MFRAFTSSIISAYHSIGTVRVNVIDIKLGYQWYQDQTRCQCKVNQTLMKSDNQQTLALLTTLHVYHGRYLSTGQWKQLLLKKRRKYQVLPFHFMSPRDEVKITLIFQNIYVTSLLEFRSYQISYAIWYFAIFSLFICGQRTVCLQIILGQLFRALKNNLNFSKYYEH